MKKTMFGVIIGAVGAVGAMGINAIAQLDTHTIPAVAEKRNASKVIHRNLVAGDVIIIRVNSSTIFSATIPANVTTAKTSFVISSEFE